MAPLGPNLSWKEVLGRGVLAPPPFPQIFNLVAEAIFILVNQFQEMGWLQGILFPYMKEKFTSFQFVDDTIFFQSRHMSFLLEFRGALPSLPCCISSKSTRVLCLEWAMIST